MFLLTQLSLQKNQATKSVYYHCYLCFVLEMRPTLVSNPDSNEGNDVELQNQS